MSVLTNWLTSVSTPFAQTNSLVVGILLGISGLILFSALAGLIYYKGPQIHLHIVGPRRFSISTGNSNTDSEFVDELYTELFDDSEPNEVEDDVNKSLKEKLHTLLVVDSKQNKEEENQEKTLSDKRDEILEEISSREDSGKEIDPEIQPDTEPPSEQLQNLESQINHFKSEIGRIHASHLSDSNNPSSVDQKLKHIENALASGKSLENLLTKSINRAQRNRADTGDVNPLLQGLVSLNKREKDAPEKLKNAVLIVDEHQQTVDALDMTINNQMAESTSGVENGGYGSTVDKRKGNQSQYDLKLLDNIEERLGEVANKFGGYSRQRQLAKKTQKLVGEFEECTKQRAKYAEKVGALEDEIGEKEQAIAQLNSKITNKSNKIDSLNHELNSAEELTNKLDQLIKTHYDDTIVERSNLSGDSQISDQNNISTSSSRWKEDDSSNTIQPGSTENPDWASSIEWVIEQFENGRYGTVDKIAKNIQNETDSSSTANTLLNCLARPEDYTEAKIRSIISESIADINKYEINFGGGNKDIDVSTVESAAERLQNRVPNIERTNLSSVVSNSIDDQLSAFKKTEEDDMLSRYTIYQKIVWLEDIFGEFDYLTEGIDAGSIQSVAEEVEDEIKDVKERRENNNRFGQANKLVDHYINFSEELYDDGHKALEEADEAKARECFRIASLLTEQIHEMYEGDKKKLMARAAGIA